MFRTRSWVPGKKIPKKGFAILVHCDIVVSAFEHSVSEPLLFFLAMLDTRGTRGMRNVGVELWVHLLLRCWCLHKFSFIDSIVIAEVRAPFRVFHFGYFLRLCILQSSKA